MPRFWKLVSLPVQPAKPIPMQVSKITNNIHRFLFPEDLGKTKLVRRSPKSGHKDANDRVPPLFDLLATKGSPSIVVTVSVDIAGLAPGVTAKGLKAIETFPGKPVTVRSIELAKKLFCGVNRIV